jgi:hypothetical protein
MVETLTGGGDGARRDAGADRGARPPAFDDGDDWSPDHLAGLDEPSATAGGTPGAFDLASAGAGARRRRPPPRGRR